MLISFVLGFGFKFYLSFSYKNIFYEATFSSLNFLLTISSNMQMSTDMQINKADIINVSAFVCKA